MSVITWSISGTSPLMVIPFNSPTRYTIANLDAVNGVNISDSSSLTGFFTLSAGSTISWDPGKPAYVVPTTAGTTVSIVVLDNSGILFNGQAIANALITGGLAGDIASAISISGAPPIDVNTVLYNTTANVASGAVWQIYLDNIAQYQSVTIWVVDEGNANRYRNINVYWGSHTAGFGVYNDEAFAIIDQGPSGVGYLGGYHTYQTGVKQKDLQLNIGAHTTSPAAVNVHVIITGSYKSITNPKFNFRCPQMAGGTYVPTSAIQGTGQDGMAGFTWLTPGAPGADSWIFSGKNGRAQLVADVGGAGAACTLALSDGAYGTLLSQNINVTPAAPLNTAVTLPNRPCRVFLNPTGAPTYVRLGIFFDPA